MTLGERIKNRRQTLGLTQQQLAEELDISPQHISAIEQNNRAPSIPNLAKLAESLGVSIDYLVTGKEGLITETIPAIKADKKLKLDAKKVLIYLTEHLHSSAGDPHTA